MNNKEKNNENEYFIVDKPLSKTGSMISANAFVTDNLVKQEGIFI